MSAPTQPRVEPSRHDKLNLRIRLNPRSGTPVIRYLLNAGNPLFVNLDGTADARVREFWRYLGRKWVLSTVPVHDKQKARLFDSQPERHKNRQNPLKYRGFARAQEKRREDELSAFCVNHWVTIFRYSV